jgi:hypothetical protein
MVLEGLMRHADSKPAIQLPEPPAPQGATRAVPTIIATDLLEKLIADRDAQAVDKIITRSRRH